jgi:hypothetical protein
MDGRSQQLRYNERSPLHTFAHIRQTKHICHTGCPKHHADCIKTHHEEHIASLVAQSTLVAVILPKSTRFELLLALLLGADPVTRKTRGFQPALLLARLAVAVSAPSCPPMKFCHAYMLQLLHEADAWVGRLVVPPVVGV